jgi:hypothetical protein
MAYTCVHLARGWLAIAGELEAGERHGDTGPEPPRERASESK